MSYHQVTFSSVSDSILHSTDYAYKLNKLTNYLELCIQLACIMMHRASSCCSGFTTWMLSSLRVYLPWFEAPTTWDHCFVSFSFDSVWNENHRMLWVGRDLKTSCSPTCLQWAGTSSTRSRCSERRSTWPWMFLGIRPPLPLWATCASVLPPSLQKISFFYLV